MSVPHKHAALIKAWADGATIQYKQMFGDHEWVDTVDNKPMWDIRAEYRIKPNHLVIYAHIRRKGRFSAAIDITCEHNWNETSNPSYTKPANVKMTFNGDTDELISIEVVK